VTVNGSPFPARPDGFEQRLERAEFRARSLNNTLRFLRFGQAKRVWKGRTAPMSYTTAQTWLAFDGTQVTVSHDGQTFSAFFFAELKWVAPGWWEVVWEIEEV